MLRGYPEPLLAAIAELRNAFLEAAESPEELVELLAAQVTDPASVQNAFEEVAEVDPQAEQAIEALLRNGGQMPVAQFSREYGAIREMGPGRLARETPWEFPDNTAELLYYHGFIGTGFSGAGPAAQSIVYVPSDVSPWLPAPQNAALSTHLAVRPVELPQEGRAHYANDEFLEDAGSLLGFLYSDKLRLTPDGAPVADDLERLVQRLQTPFRMDSPGAPDADRKVRLDFLLHLANRLGWLRRGEDDAVELTGNRVSAFLDATRAEQRRMLWDAWLSSPDWNDLCRTPELECVQLSKWSNDPVQTRALALGMLSALTPGEWFSQDEVLHAIRDMEPDFQRPTGEYDSWYIRSSTTQEYFKGFEQWDLVEGALLRFYLRGPLHWLQAMDLAEPSAGDDMQISLSQWGAYWLAENAPQPHEPARSPLRVSEDFTVVVPYGTPLIDRFRVERFAAWQQSRPDYVYQINQRVLRQAQENGITASRIVAFLRERTKAVPDNVEAALMRFAAIANSDPAVH